MCVYERPAYESQFTKQTHAYFDILALRISALGREEKKKSDRKKRAVCRSSPDAGTGADRRTKTHLCLY